MMEFTWVTLSGDKLTISQMSEEHILNSIRWLSRDSEMIDEKDGISVREWLIAFAEELTKRMG